MITYNASYTEGSKPYLAKVLTAGETSMEVKLVPSSGHDELDLVPLESLYQHLNNIVQYLKDMTALLEVYSLDDPAMESRYPFKGYGPIDEISLEANLWWQYMFFHREADEETPA
jgi:hypothetical protein